MVHLDICKKLSETYKLLHLGLQILYFSLLQYQISFSSQKKTWIFYTFDSLIYGFCSFTNTNQPKLFKIISFMWAILFQRNKWRGEGVVSENYQKLFLPFLYSIKTLKAHLFIEISLKHFFMNFRRFLVIF